MAEYLGSIHYRYIFFQFMAVSNKSDPINQLDWKEQSIIFRLRTQYVPLNFHLNRINPTQDSLSPICQHPYETVKHFSFECQNLKELRKLYLPPNPNIGSILLSFCTIWKSIREEIQQNNIILTKIISSPFLNPL